MKRQLLLSVGLLLGAAATQAQTLTPNDQPTQQYQYQTSATPVDLQYMSSWVEGNYRVQQLAAQEPAIAQPDSTRRLAEREIPNKLRKVLRKDDQYAGWNNAGVYRDSTTNLYVISIENENHSVTYNMNEDGKAVLVTQSYR
ncbi:hypothetical protein [Dawidia soli]|uniref:Uncharacterized protein n=1 Tax=Dawidia soli TaxID=2782352 RepID=A0AAP2DF36_9BACT|nr:hypothetical protein [Dawidia soli]MBT1689951.1 hypothetical protein [Dawidia soli]